LPLKDVRVAITGVSTPLRLDGSKYLALDSPPRI
jgi:hypothetical protein